MVRFIYGSGLKELKFEKVKAFRFGLMVQSMKDGGSKTRLVEKVG